MNDMQLDKVLTEIKQGDVSFDDLSDFYRKLKKLVLNRRKALAAGKNALTSIREGWI